MHSSPLHTLPLLLLAVGLGSCDEVSPADRLVYVQPAQVRRAVLIEDFTGQRCVNCPLATDEIHRLQQEYGDTAVIAVGIHSGPFGKNARGALLSLATQLGDSYYDHWGVESQPKGVINRHGTSEYADWGTLVHAQLQQTAPLELGLTLTYAPQTRTLTSTVKAFGTNGATDGHLQLWLTEDNIVDVQLMPDGSTNRDYVHNHVLRAAINGPWGDTFRIAEGDSTFLLDARTTGAATYSITLDPAWKADDVAVVAFVYTDDGVAQVTTRHAPRVPSDE